MDRFPLNALGRIGNVDQNEMSIIVDRLVDVYHPLQIYLFGSYAWGTPSVESDYDLCVIVESSGEKKTSRSRKGRNALLDIICRRGIGLSPEYNVPVIHSLCESLCPLCPLCLCGKELTTMDTKEHKGQKRAYYFSA